MGHTIGKRWPFGKAPAGDFACLCDYCGVRYRRSQLVRKPNGLLACTGAGTFNDASERDAVTLAELEAENATRNRPIEPIGDPGNFDEGA